jgi:uncharacterized protein YdaU (DUF1376 family)
MNQRAHFFPFPCKDFLVETALFTAEQRGALVTLLAYAWLDDEPCTVPDDDAKLAKLSGLGKRWTTAGMVVRERFESFNGRLRNAALWAAYQRMIEEHKRKSDAGRRGGQKRWAQEIASRERLGPGNGQHERPMTVIRDMGDPFGAV